MFSFSLKNRIASYYIISTALLVFGVFSIIYIIVSYTVYDKVSQNINYELEEYSEGIKFENNKIQLINKNEWRQNEHNEVYVNPVFLELLNSKGGIIQKSENLHQQELRYIKSKSQIVSDVVLDGKLLRQVQAPIIKNNTIVGYIIVALSLEESTIILDNLLDVLLISYPITLLVLFFIAQFIAGRSIQPIRNIIETSSKISQENLNQRIGLPVKKDELYILAQTINDLLDRVQNAVIREKELTSDASHELRTPLSVIKGTLEVLIRKPRNQSEYEDRINFCIKEVDRLNYLVSEMLLLARFESQIEEIKITKISLNMIVLDVLSRFSEDINSKKLTINHSFSKEFYIHSDDYLTAIIISNIISNAIKYSKQEGQIDIKISKVNNKKSITISDTGIGINKADLSNIFKPFFRSNVFDHPEIKGTGLGLSIVKRLCAVLHFTFEISSKLNEGTTATLYFYEKD